MSDKYDLIVVGGGPGGMEAAQTAAQKKKRVLIIEKNGWGGTCAHRGCIPTKALLSCSKSYMELKKLKRFGVHVDGTSVDFMAMKNIAIRWLKSQPWVRKRTCRRAGGSKIGNRRNSLSCEVQLIEPSGQSQLLETKNILIAWGSEPRFTGHQTSERIMTSDGILDLTTLTFRYDYCRRKFHRRQNTPRYLRNSVSKVILVELLDRILPQEDEEAAEFLTQELARLGIAVHTSTELISLKESEAGVVMQVRKNSETMEMRSGCALLCTGRNPLLHRTELDRLGIEYGRAGIKVDKNMMTTVRGIYAAGDVTGGMMLAHRAARQAKASVEHMYGGIGNLYNEKFIPTDVYSHPQIARVGNTEERARKEGLSIETIRSPYSANIIARTELMGQGFVKAVFHQDKIIGAVILGDLAADLISGLALAVASQLTRKQLRSWVIPHPTLSEIFVPLFG